MLILITLFLETKSHYRIRKDYQVSDDDEVLCLNGDVTITAVKSQQFLKRSCNLYFDINQKLLHVVGEHHRFSIKVNNDIHKNVQEAAWSVTLSESNAENISLLLQTISVGLNPNKDTTRKLRQLLDGLVAHLDTFLHFNGCSDELKETGLTAFKGVVGEI